MRIGICKLCLQQEKLQKSHFILAAFYKYILTPTESNPNPVVVGRTVTATTSKQVRDYLLCAECEDLFNKNGEQAIVKWVWNGKDFPQGNRLAVAHEHFTLRKALVFSGRAIGIDVEEIAYCALSVIWRAAVHQWNLMFGDKSTVLCLGKTEESIRKYLHGDADFPDQVAITATVCTDRTSMTFYPPCQATDIPASAFGFLALGIRFLVYVGDNIPHAARRVCFMKSEHQLLFQRDCSQKNIRCLCRTHENQQTHKGVGLKKASRGKPLPPRGSLIHTAVWNVCNERMQPMGDGDSLRKK